MFIQANNFNIYLINYLFIYVFIHLRIMYVCSYLFLTILF